MLNCAGLNENWLFKRSGPQERDVPRVTRPLHRLLSKVLIQMPCAYHPAAPGRICHPSTTRLLSAMTARGMEMFQRRPPGSQSTLSLKMLNILTTVQRTKQTTSWYLTKSLRRGTHVTSCAIKSKRTWRQWLLSYSNRRLS
jgi:hypothetical protein